MNEENTAKFYPPPPHSSYQPKGNDIEIPPKKEKKPAEKLQETDTFHQIQHGK
jgi:hypothetical protein